MVARLPADWITKTRSSAGFNTCSLRNVLTLSTPALVRVSDMKNRPVVEPQSEAIRHLDSLAGRATVRHRNRRVARHEESVLAC